LIFLAAALLVGAAKIEEDGLAYSAKLRPLKEPNFAQGYPTKRAATASISTTDRVGIHHFMLMNTGLANQMEILFRFYRYHRLYGSPNGGYFAFESASAPRFDTAITRPRARAYGATNGRPGL
jgi:hypothetical protein